MKKYVIASIAAILITGGIIAALFLTKAPVSTADDPAKSDPAQQSATLAPTPTQAPTEPPTEAPTEAPLPETYMIEGVEVIPQVEFKAGCETYACTMLLQTLGYDMNERMFMENYLEIRYPSYDENGNMYAPDMYSSQVGDIYGGWGVYCTAMAKYMNHYLSDVNSDQKATAIENVPLEELCREYVSKGIPVMIWGTVEMLEPYPRFTWTVDYVDENAHYKIGDQFSWLQHEHCLVLIGWDEENFYFADSCAGKVSVFEKELSETRYETLGMQAIVVK